MSEKKKPEIIEGSVISLGNIITNISGSVVTTSGSIVEGYNQLRGSFTVNQMNIAQQMNIENKITTLNTDTKKLDDSIKEQVKLTKDLVKLTKEQVDDAKKEAKTNRNRFYVTTIIAIIAVIIALKAIFH